MVRENMLLRMPEGSVCAEIGVHEGEFSEQILAITKPELLHLIDPWKHEENPEYRGARYGGLGSEGQARMDERYERVREKFAAEIQRGQVKLHRDFSGAVAGEFEDSYFDWIYLDGNHLYDFVLQDLELYFPKVKAGGYITGDDYGKQGWWDNGIQRAVDEFVSRNDSLSLKVIGTQYIIRK
jgi:hypothetical protein